MKLFLVFFFLLVAIVSRGEGVKTKPWHDCTCDVTCANGDVYRGGNGWCRLVELLDNDLNLFWTPEVYGFLTYCYRSGGVAIGNYLSNCTWGAELIPQPVIPKNPPPDFVEDK